MLDMLGRNEVGARHANQTIGADNQSMSYHDIDDWADENIPMDLFDSFEDWINEIESSFANHGHFFPDGMRDTLRQHWIAEFGEEELDEPEESFAEPAEFRREPEPTAQRPIVVVREPERIVIYEREKPPHVIEVPPDGFRIEVRREPTTAEKFREARTRAKRGRNN